MCVRVGCGGYAVENADSVQALELLGMMQLLFNPTAVQKGRCKNVCFLSAISCSNMNAFQSKRLLIIGLLAPEDFEVLKVMDLASLP